MFATFPWGYTLESLTANSGSPSSRLSGAANLEPEFRFSFLMWPSLFLESPFPLILGPFLSPTATIGGSLTYPSSRASWVFLLLCFSWDLQLGPPLHYVSYLSGHSYLLYEPTSCSLNWLTSKAQKVGLLLLPSYPLLGSH